MDRERYEKRKQQVLKARKRYIQKALKKQQEKKELLRENPELRPKIKKFSSKMEEMHKKDEIFYKEIWNERPHYCENCGKYLGKNFYDNEGKIKDIFRYAHIISKAIYKYLRHYKENILLLCFECHNKLDHTPKEIYSQMKCYDEERIEKLKILHKDLKQRGINLYK